MNDSYSIKLRDDAVKEWKKLGVIVQRQFAKKLKSLIENPHGPCK